MTRQSPPISEELLRRLLPDDEVDAALGDLAEEFAQVAQARGKWRARWWYRKEAALLILHMFRAEMTSLARRHGRSSRRTLMSRRKLVPLAAAVVLNVAALALFWLLTFGMIQFAQLITRHWTAPAIAGSIGCAIGVAIAIRLRAAVCAYFLAGQLAFGAAELLIHSAYGIHAVQGAPTHFAVMGAATLGVIFGALLVRFISRKNLPPPAAAGTFAEVQNAA